VSGRFEVEKADFPSHLVVNAVCRQAIQDVAQALRPS
jgi:hypothetical protein